MLDKTGNVGINVAFRRVLVTTVAVKKAVSTKYYEGIFCSLRYPTRKAHAPCYIFICGLSGSTTFSQLCRKLHDLREKVIEHKMCFDFFLQRLSETFLILRRNARDIIINT